MRVVLLFLSLLFFFAVLEAEETFSLFDEDTANLFKDLKIVEKVNREIQDHLPLLFNYQMQGGYFTMPSAKMAKAGLWGFEFSYLPPYRLYNLLFQFFDHVEITGNYWLFSGVQDVSLGKSFGTFSDRAANIKVSLLRKEDGLPMLPEFAIGVNDFIGTQRFKSFYIVATQTFLKWNLEATLGWGSGRIQGFFGALAWSLFHKLGNKFFKELTFVAEYDANNYKHHGQEHSKGKEVAFPINLGLHYTLFDIFKLRLSSIRGKDLAASASISYNFGTTEGFFPKSKNPMPYLSPVDHEPIGILRTKKELGQELSCAFQKQGFDVYTILQTTDKCKKDTLWIKLVNVRYRIEDVVRDRIVHVLSSLIPENIASITVVIEADGLLVHEYIFSSDELYAFQEKKICDKEISLISHFKHCHMYKE